MRTTSKTETLAWAGAFLFALLFPVICGFDRYLIHVAISISFNVALATSLWLIWTLGFISFAHAGFMGIGAYTSALLLTKLGIPMWIGVWAGAIVAAAIALLLSIPLMRTRAVYFFMASWAIGEVVKRIFAFYREPFGGWNGIFNITPPTLSLFGLEIDFSSRTAYYYLALLGCVAVVLIIYRLNKSRTGMIYWAIHQNETLAQHVGINVFWHKVAGFTVACTLAAFIGVLYAHYHTYINPKSFDIWKSEFALVHVIVGGLSTVAGPVFGAVTLTVVDELLRATGYFRVMFFGVIIIATVPLLPGGLESIPGRLKSAFANWKRRG